MEANNAGEVDPKIRAKLYAALKRIMANADADKVYVPAAVICRYRDSVVKGKKPGCNDMFFLLREFVKDPTCLSMTFTEEHVRESIKYTHTEMMWVTRVEAIVMFHGHVWEEGKQHAEKLLSLAKVQKPNPMAPKDKDLRLFKIHKSIVEGEAKKNTARQSLAISGNVADTDAAQKMMVAMGGKPIKAAVEDADDAEGSCDQTQKVKKNKIKPQAKAGKRKAAKVNESAKELKVPVGVKSLKVMMDYKMKTRRLASKLKAASQGRLDLACVDTLESMVPAITAWCTKLEEAELQASQDPSGNADMKAELDKAFTNGALRLLEDELEFAENRLDRLK